MPPKVNCSQVNNKQPISPLRKRYIVRLVGRCAVLLISLVLFIARPTEFNILNGLNFFDKFSVFHILWIIWIVDMICQLFPIKNHIPLGSQKLFRNRFKPIREKINYPALKKHILATTKAAGAVMIFWVLLVVIIGAVYFRCY